MVNVNNALYIIYKKYFKKLPLILQMYINKKRYQPVAENKALGYCHYDQDIYIEKECVILF